MKKRILVVDDERGVADSLRLVLEQAGYEVLSCYSGAEALAQGEQFKPDILISDVLMPGMNGFELAMAVKKIFPMCRLVLFSGQAASAQLAQRYIAPFAAAGYLFELLPKPVHPDALLANLELPFAAASTGHGVSSGQ